MKHLRNAAFLTAFVLPAMLIPVTLHAQDRDRERSYHDQRHNDDHRWDDHEDRAYRMWVKERHRKYVAFEVLKDRDRENYWAWRHEHSDAILKIDIR